MYIKLDYFNFSAFDLEVKATEILEYILLFIKREKQSGARENYQF